MRQRLILTMCALTMACTDPLLEPSLDVSVQLAKGGGGRGGGPGGGDESPLNVTLGPGSITNDGGGVYINGQGGVDATLRSDGGLRFVLAPDDSRRVFIGRIEDSGGETLVAETGLVDAQITTPACCDLRAMSTGDSVKVKIRWNVSDGWYVVTMGSTSNCGTGGDWAHVTRTIAADTTWVIQSVGPAKLCRVIDLPGKKNDDTFWLAADAIVDLTLQFSTN